MRYDPPDSRRTLNATKGNTVADDLFENEGGPSAKSLLKAKGDKFTGRVLGPAKKIQTKDFDTEEPAFWPAKGNEEPKPKLAHVINLDINGEIRSLWCPIPSDLNAKLLDALRNAEVRNVEADGFLTVELVGEEPRKGGKKGYAKKLHAVTYVKPAYDVTDEDDSPL